jgi:hypothetical protein
MDEMTKKYYAGYNPYGTNFTYFRTFDSDVVAWSVAVFSSKSNRDQWVDEDDYPNGNPTREVITRDIVRRIMGNHCRGGDAITNRDGVVVGHWLETSYNDHYFD